MYNALGGVRRGHFGEETQEVYVWGKTCTVRESGTEARSGAVEQGGTWGELILHRLQVTLIEEI